MTLKVDNVGRVIVPKLSLIHKGSFFVHTGSLPASFDLLRLIDDERNDRDKRLLSL